MSFRRAKHLSSKWMVGKDLFLGCWPNHLSGVEKTKMQGCPNLTSVIHAIREPMFPSMPGHNSAWESGFGEGGSSKFPLMSFSQAETAWMVPICLTVGLYINSPHGHFQSGKWCRKED